MEKAGLFILLSGSTRSPLDSLACCPSSYHPEAQDFSTPGQGNIGSRDRIQKAALEGVKKAALQIITTGLVDYATEFGYSLI